MYNILVCDDEKDIVSALKIYLSAEGYKVFEAYNGEEAVAIVDKEDIHLVLLDIMMPEMDGITALSKMRELSNVPVILLTAKSEDTDKVLGLNMGADDYVTKPFNPLELMARVKSQIRRFTALGSMEKKEGVITSGGLSLDVLAKELTLDGEPVKLTATEYGIMKVLMENLGRVLSSDQIYEAVWDEPAFDSRKTVTVHIKRIRDKIEINPKDAKYLKVVWGIGYKIEKY